MDPKYIIVSGTNKAATTSLFNYLSDHPDICGSYIKQTNYFLDQDIQERFGLNSILEYDESKEKYKEFFKCENKFRLEASPDYMFYESSIKKIQSFLASNDGEIVLILRNPVTRFKSWYNFGKQLDLIDKETSLRTFFNESKHYKGDENIALLAYKTGFYSDYIKTIQKIISKDRIKVYFYEHLKENPSLFITNLCDDFQIDKEFYNDYAFKHHNKSVKTKSKTLNKLYNFARGVYLKYFFKGKFGVYMGKNLKQVLNPIYNKINTTKLSNDIDKETIELLNKEYRLEKEKLQELLKINDIPW